jgi:hypothetical protein
MSALVNPSATTHAHGAFTAAWNRIEDALAYQFRTLPGALREEAIAEARAYNWAAWQGLIRRGKDPVAVGVVAIAANSARAVKNGRSLGGGRASAQALRDVACPQKPALHGLRVVGEEETAAGSPHRWEDFLATDHRYTPADEAAFRIDFREWLDRLPARKRAAAELLADGYSTGEAARRLNVSACAISLDRQWLARSWAQFQGEDDSPC